MGHTFLIYLGSFLVAVWGAAHLFPTGDVVKGFGDISIDNKRVITMEWINEGITLIFIGSLVTAVTLVDPASAVSRTVYWSVIVMLNAMSILSLCTGFRVHFIPYRLCPILFTGASVLILLGLYV